MKNTGKQFDAEAFLGILYSHLKQVGDRESLTMESNLYALGLDSMGAVNLLFELEEVFGVIFPDAFLTEATFETPRALQLAIASLV